MSTIRSTFVSGIAVSMLFGAAALADAPAQFVPLGFLDPDNFGPVIAYGISANGGIVVGQSNSPTGLQAFRWTQASGIEGLGAFPNPGGLLGSGARACSADGSVIVGSSLLPNSLNEDGSPFRWTEKTGLVFLGSLGGTSGGVARGVSSDGSVVAGYSSNVNFNLEAFRWENNVMMGLGDLPGGVFNSQAAAVSGDGSVIVGLASTSASPYNRSFMWTQAGGTVEIVPASFRAIGMSRDGHFAVGINNGRAARLDLQSNDLTMIPHVAIAGLVNDTDSAWGANADGSVVVGNHNLSQFNGFFGRAFMWDQQHGTRIIRDVLINQYGLGQELAGWELNNATCVSDDGLTMAGYGFAPSGEQAAWRVKFSHPCAADISPAPGSGGDGVVNSADLLMIINNWGPCPDPNNCPADINKDHVVNSADLLMVINAWGPCS